MCDVPVNVSPLIKFGRWSLLLTGFFYGSFHQRRLKKKETKQRQVQAEQKIAKEAKLAEERRVRAENEKKALALLTK